VEVHVDPNKAFSDGQQTITPDEFTRLISDIAALAILDEEEETKARALRNFDNLKSLSDGLKQLGLDVTPSQTNFVLVRCPGHAGELTQKLLERGVIVRPMSAFGLGDGAIRISVGLPAENKKCLDALKEILT
jgi:histidinol-phosphate aminotransferase